MRAAALAASLWPACGKRKGVDSHSDSVLMLHPILLYPTEDKFSLGVQEESNSFTFPLQNSMPLRRTLSFWLSPGPGSFNTLCKSIFWPSPPGVPWVTPSLHWLFCPSSGVCIRTLLSFKCLSLSYLLGGAIQPPYLKMKPNLPILLILSFLHILYIYLQIMYCLFSIFSVQEVNSLSLGNLLVILFNIIP